jgi:hypothetical protein
LADQGAPSPITPRALLAGALLALLLGLGATYENLLISGSPLHLDYSTPAAVFLFFLFVLLVNPLLALLGGRWRFSQAELVTVYLMAAVACTLPTNGLVCVLLPHVSAGTYYATPENEWSGRVLPFVQGWLRVQDEQAIKWFYEGLPAGEELPWRAWLAPLAAWAPMLLAFFGASTALMVLVRRQWIASERLAFPLVQVPLAVIGEEEKSPPRLLARFFRTPAAWIGMAVPLLLYSQRALHNYFPFIPDAMPIAQYYFFWDDKFRLRLSLSYAVVGFGYLLSTKLGFSIWFLGLLTSLEHALMLHFGVPGTERAAGNALGSSNLVFQGFGAMVALCLGSLWVARGHLREIARRAWRGEAAAAGELLSCRQALLLLAGSTGGMVVWLSLSGMSWWVASLTLLVALALMYAITRIVAEGGLAVTRPPIMPNDALIHALGSAFLGPHNTGALGMIQPWGGAMRTTLMAAVIHGLRLAEDYAIANRRRLLWAVLLAAVVATVSASWNVLRLGYQHGALNLSFWFFGYEAATEPYTFAAYHLGNPQGATAAFWQVAGLGALVQVLLTLAYQRFLWWPIHPIAFPVSATWTTHHLMPSIFLAWLVKTAVLRYGGVTWYQRTRPFFLGLILGHYVAGGLWILIDGFTGKTANYLFYW